MTTDPRRMALLELALVCLTGVAFLAIPKPPAAVTPIAVFIPSCIAGWAVFLRIRLRQDPELRVRWGLRPRYGLGDLVPLLLPLFAVAVAGSALVALATGRPLLPEHILVSLLLYPVWGFVQQWLVQALLVDNVRILTGAPVGVLAAVGAVGFGAVHVEHPLLVLATAMMGGVYVVLFQRRRNLLPLAICHGWLGSVFYPWVLGINPTAELIARLAG